MHRIAWSAHWLSLSKRLPNKLALSNGQGENLSFQELCNQVHHVARYFQSRGCRHGDRIATLLPNILPAVWMSHGLRVAGLCEVALGWGQTDEELQWCKQLASVDTIVSTPEQFQRLKALGWDVINLPQTAQAEIDAANESEGFEGVDGSVWARLMFTSGTTGKTKAVVYDHRSRWQGELLQKSEFPFKPRPGDQVVLMTPFVHGAGLIASAWMDYGAEVVLLQGVDLNTLRQVIGQKRVKAIFAPPTVLAKLVAAFESEPIEPIACVFTGTQALSENLYLRSRRIFGDVIRITYGKTECVNPITILPAWETAQGLADGLKLGGSCVGWPAPGVEISIGSPRLPDRQKDDEPDNDSPAQIWIRASHMSVGMITTEGYKAHEPDGWHATGDLGFIDNLGRLFLSGRMADVIKTGGYRVNPDEIETLLAAVPGVPHLAITALPSEYWGEIIVAVGEVPKARDPSESQMLPQVPDDMASTQHWVEACQARVLTLSAFKRPRLFLELEQLPRNAQGKISRKAVTEALLKRYRLLDGPYPSVEERMPIKLKLHAKNGLI